MVGLCLSAPIKDMPQTVCFKTRIAVLDPQSFMSVVVSLQSLKDRQAVNRV